MKKIFIDNDVLLDFFLERKNFFVESKTIFSLAELKKIKLYISALTIANSYYIIRSKHGDVVARNIISKLLLLVKVLPINQNVITQALNSSFKDYEDAIQHFSAVLGRMTCVVTRNIKDYKHSILPVLSPKEFVITCSQ